MFSLQDVAYHGFAALLYLSASVLLAYITYFIGNFFTKDNISTVIAGADLKDNIVYKLDVAAVVSPCT